MNNRKVMEQALETLEWCEPDYDENPTGFKKWAAVMPILREALVVPEQRKWVGLTNKEQREIYKKYETDGWGLFYNAIEAALRSKNT